MQQNFLLVFLVVCLTYHLSLISASRQLNGLRKEEVDDLIVDLWSNNQRQKKGGEGSSSLGDGTDNRKRKDRKERKDKKGSRMKSGNSERKRKESKEITAIRRWAESLKPEDYDYENWKNTFNTKLASDFFNGYARRISDIWKEVGAKVNFALVGKSPIPPFGVLLLVSTIPGACDGLGDKTIKNLYLPNDHWRGVFVEPVSINVKDLIQFMANKNVAHRSLIIRAAATFECSNATIKMERPLYEEKNKSIPVKLACFFSLFFAQLILCIVISIG
jgi:hypothetical protein